MKKLFIVTIWILVSMYLLGYCFDGMNASVTLFFAFGLLGVLLIGCLSVKYRLGLKLITKKQNKKL